MQTRLITAMLVLMAGLLVLATGCINDNVRPVALFTVDQANGSSPLTVNFDGSGSYAQDGTIESYFWDFGDGTSGSGITTTHVFTSSTERAYTVKLTVTDDDGKTGSMSGSIVVTSSPNGTTLFFDDFEDGADPAWAFPTGNWEVKAGRLHLADSYTSGAVFGYVLGGEGWRDYSVEADILYGDQSIPKQALVLRSQDDLNKVLFVGRKSSLYFNVYKDGNIIVYKGSEVYPGLPNESHVTITVEGNTYKGYVNGVLRIEFVDSTFLSGTAGVGLSGAYGGNSAKCQFDNFAVRVLE